jgi:cellulose synthase/poly-beta-1,6-N-acetylglucosamine synthase-like glycosyltransferase
VRNLQRLYHRANHNFGKILLFGLLGVSIYNLYQWMKYRKFNQGNSHQDGLDPLDEWPDRPRVSVLVAAWNEAGFIKQHIRSFLGLHYPDKELIISAGGIDGTHTAAHQHSSEDVIVLPQSPGQGKQGALSSCFSECSGEIIYLTDADCILDDQSFERVIYPIACGQESACTGGSQPFKDSLNQPLVTLQAASDFFQFTNPRRPRYYPGMFGRNCALNRNAVHSTGDFSSPAPTGTDYVLAMGLNQKKIRIRQIRNSLIRSEYPHNPGEYISQKRRWHRNVLFYSLRYRNLRELARSFSLSVIALSMLLIPALSLLFGQLLLIPWICLLLNGFLSRQRYLHFLSSANNCKAPVSSLDILFSLFLDFGAWSLAVLDLFFPGLRRTW